MNQSMAYPKELNRLILEVQELRGQLADLRLAAQLHGVTVLKCRECGKVLPDPGKRGWTSGAVRYAQKGLARYYCEDHLDAPVVDERLADCTDAEDRDNFTIMVKYLMTYARPVGALGQPVKPRPCFYLWDREDVKAEARRLEQ